MYKVNDTIIYGTQGVCRITGIATKNVLGKACDYYILTPLSGSSCTIYAPIDSEITENKMHRLLSCDEIYEIIRSMPDEKALWIENENERRKIYKQILSEGKRSELIKMMKAIYSHKKEQKSKGKRLHIADERFFKEAEKILYDEFAAVLDIKPSQVTEFITSRLCGDSDKMPPLCD